MKTYITILTLVLLGSFGKGQDKGISNQLSAQLAVDSKQMGLYYPGSVKRFYLKNGYQPAWIKPQDGMGRTWQAMLMLDCILQFGLAHADYHPMELSYDSLHTMLEEPEKLGTDVKARFDILLTDAMITFMNHLHYGKFNPEYLPERIDRGIQLPFLAVEKLSQVLLEKDLGGVLDVQPKSKLYRNLQEYMRLVKGQYLDDCYEVPEADVRLAAINMERIRWANLSDEAVLHVNIPSYTLDLYEPDSTYGFKIIVGRPQTPTPTLSSAIGYFSTAPDWKVPQKIFIRELLPKALAHNSYFEDHKYTVYDKTGTAVHISRVKLNEIQKNPSGYSLRQSSGCDNALGSVVFHFPNSFDIYLHDSPDKQLFDRNVRSLSHGCIRVQKADELAALLLRYDDASAQIPLMNKYIKGYLKKDFKLKRPVPIKVTYLTCAFKNGELVRYKDIYHLDKLLEKRLYLRQEQLATN
jgi:murein L,D-transpeptidase YcbB/YkuD